MNSKSFKNEDAALLEIESSYPENLNTPLLKDLIVFGPKSEISNEAKSQNTISSKIHIINIFLSFVSIILGMVLIGSTIFGIVKMGSVAKYYTSSIVFSLFVGILQIVAGLCGIQLKLREVYNKYFVIFVIAIQSGCMLVLLLVAANTFQILVTRGPYSYFRKITLGVFVFSMTAVMSLIFHLMVVIKYIK